MFPSPSLPCWSPWPNWPRRRSRCASLPNPYCRVAVLEPSRARLLSTSPACLPPSPRPRRPFLLASELATAARHGRQDPLGGEILLPVIIFDNQRLKSTFLDSLKLMLSSFQCIPRVSMLVLSFAATPTCLRRCLCSSLRLRACGSYPLVCPRRLLASAPPPPVAATRLATSPDADGRAQRCLAPRRGRAPPTAIYP